MVGKPLGHYEVLEPLGAGGMGEVYRARDTKLERDVAIKVLPEDFAADQERLARFEREARLLASLNHANIAAIYGLEDEGDRHFIVMELVEGETLAERIARSGRIDVDEALEIARQIAEALEVAHENGVIHRDLKPANVIVTSDGKAKVLDFGLAKVSVSEGGNNGESATHSPTATVGATEAGVLLGTAPYMSPEQAKGKILDKRADIWAFGCVVFEMLTGMRPFQGENVTETLAAILKEEPDWGLLPVDTPPLAASLFRRCLRKDPSRRLRDIGDARIEIEDSLADPAAHPLAGPAPSATARPVVLSGTALFIPIAVALGAILSWTLAPERALPVSRTVVPLESSARQDFGGMRPFAISPDGRRIVYVAMVDRVQQLWIRAVDAFEAEPIPGTEGGLGPFFSPDGESIGFFTPGRLNTASLAGGQPFVVCEIDVNPGGGTWSLDDTIVFGVRGPTGLMQVPAAGGTPVPVLVPDPEKGEASFERPRFLPDGESLIFTAENPAPGEIRALRLASGEDHMIVRGTDGQYSASRHLVYAEDDGNVLSVGFDPTRLEIVGRPTSIREPVLTDSGGSAYFDISDTGTLVYVPKPSHVRSLVWVSRDGSRTAASARLGPYQMPRVSPDGTKLAVVLGPFIDSGIETLEIARDVAIPLTGTGTNAAPVWSPDGQSIYFSSIRTGSLFFDIYRKLVGASSGDAAQTVLSKDGTQLVTDLSSDGRYALFVEGGPRGDIGVFDLLQGGEPEYIVATRAFEADPRFSPDGRWVAYQSNEPGTNEVYVLSFPDRGAARRISRDGGTEPVWSRDGRELYFRNGPELLAIRVDSEGRFDAEPEVLFEAPDILSVMTNYDVAPDGRFVMVFEENAAGPPGLRVVLNWFEELNERAPTGGSR